jgi:hypothetical protein
LCVRKTSLVLSFSKGFIFLFLLSNMKRPVTHWYTKDQPIFENTEDIGDSKIDVARIPGGSDSPPCMKISHNTFETMEKANWEFLRLSLPVTCQSSFIELVFLKFLNFLIIFFIKFSARKKKPVGGRKFV